MDSKKQKNIPRHIAIIMDGNNRWAKKRFLPGVAGHKAGADAVRAVIRGCVDQGVEVLTLFAFSSENWRRPQKEVNALMDLFLVSLRREVRKLHKYDIRLRIIGDKSGFSDDIQQAIEEAETLTEGNNGLQLNIAANYGGRWDIVHTAQQLARQVAEGLLKPEDITEQRFNQAISLGDLPAPDLCIRTAGEQRISNYLLWQFAYSEFYYSPLLWPDFKEKALAEAIEDFAGRQRRFGKTSEQIEGKADA